MIDYNKRSFTKEFLDGNDIPFADIQQNMKELDFINTHLGGHTITLNGFSKLLGSRKKVWVCETGCGGGDNLKAIYEFCSKRNINIKFTGIDINEDCIVYAKLKTDIPGINFIVSDYEKVDFGSNKPDIIFSSLFCHHFTDEELIDMMLWMKKNSILGFFINDLHRHPIAYWFIKLAGNLFSKSYLVKNDAPLSVLRGFKKRDWIKILHLSGITTYSIKWKWAFRYLITVTTTND